MNGGHRKENDAKLVLLLLPAELQNKQAVLRLLQIQKKEGLASFTYLPLGRKEVAEHFAALPEAARTVLLRFRPEQVDAVRKEAGLRFKKQKAGVSLQSFSLLSLHRYVHQQFQELKPFFHQLKWYHQLRKPGGQGWQTLACGLRVEKPVLRFGVKKNNHVFSLQIEVSIEGEIFPLDAFLRTAFFLQQNRQYYLLSFADYQTLEWLHEQLGEGLPPEDFREKILPRLQENYTVNQNGLLEEETVTVAPACRVLLSELNHAFLLLTPQWLYDGILVEGAWKESQEVTLAAKRYWVRRDKESEDSFLQQLTALHPNFSNQHNGYYYLSFADAQKKHWFMQTYHRLLALNVEVAGMDLLQHFRYSPHRVQTTLAMQGEDKGSLHLKMEVRFGMETVSLITLQKALYAGQRAVMLKDGSLGLLNDEWLESYATVVKHARIKEQKLQVSKFLFFAENGSGESLPWQPEMKEDWQQQWKQWQQEEAPLYALPSIVQARLRPYQRKGFEWLVLLSKIGAGACLADDMGLGKTLQTICFLAWYSARHPDRCHLIVCPTSLLYNWQQELRKFAPSLRVEILHASARSEKSANPQVIITSYGTLRNQSETFLSQLFGVAVIDESHHIKNPAAQITRITQQIQAGMRLALSGTPVVNNTFDLYSQFSFALPGLLGSREFFKREYADAIDRYGDETKIAALQRLTAPFVFRRTKEQVAADLPAKTESVLWCTMSAAQEELYNEIREQVRSNLLLGIREQGVGKTKLAVLQGLLKLRQVCNDPQLLPPGEHQGRLQSAKTDLLLEELLKVLGRHKVLVFSQFSSMLYLLAGACRKKGIDSFLLDGQTPAGRRMQMVRDFQENTEAPSLFFISLKAGNTGLTLTAADYVFLFDPWWNTAVEQQAVDRTHRIGQTKNVFAYKLVCKNTIEEKILDLQARKQKLAQELIGAEEDFVKSLGEEEIAYLFS